jgi:hypothetical protein
MHLSWLTSNYLNRKLVLIFYWRVDLLSCLELNFLSWKKHYFKDDKFLNLGIVWSDNTIELIGGETMSLEDNFLRSIVVFDIFIKNRDLFIFCAHLLNKRNSQFIILTLNHLMTLYNIPYQGLFVCTFQYKPFTFKCIPLYNQFYLLQREDLFVFIYVQTNQKSDRLIEIQCGLIIRKFLAIFHDILQ